MDLKGSQKFNANPQAVWDALHNADVLKSVMPGVTELEWQGDSALAIAGTVEMGPIKQSVRGTLSVPESNPPSHMKFTIARSGVNADGTIDLAPDGTGT